VGTVIDKEIVRYVDAMLDQGTGSCYREQPLAQDWARVAKLAEETGEAIAELILATGQNPRKPLDGNAKARLLHELADAALTGIYAIQHFTKGIEITQAYLREAQDRHRERARAWEQESGS
jgi:hypothetical protein